MPGTFEFNDLSTLAVDADFPFAVFPTVLNHDEEQCPYCDR